MVDNTRTDPSLRISRLQYRNTTKCWKFSYCPADLKLFCYHFQMKWKSFLMPRWFFFVFLLPHLRQKSGGWKKSNKKKYVYKRESADVSNSSWGICGCFKPLNMLIEHILQKKTQILVKLNFPSFLMPHPPLLCWWYI